MHLLAIAGGSAGSIGFVLCCGIFPLLPLVILMAWLACRRNSVWWALAAVFVAVVPFSILLLAVATDQPSDDWEVMEEQAMARLTLLSFVCHLLVAGIAAAGVALQRHPFWKRRWPNKKRGEAHDTD